MDTATRVQILGKVMNPIILPPATGKIVGQTGFFSLGEGTSLEFKPAKLRLEIDLMSYPAQAEGLVNRISKDIESRHFLFSIDISSYYLTTGAADRDVESLRFQMRIVRS